MSEPQPYGSRGRPGSDYLTMLAAERAGLLHVLDKLTEAQWDTPSLCAGWSIRHVVAHLIAGATDTMAEIEDRWQRYPDDVDRGFAEDAVRTGSIAPRLLLEQFRAIVDTTHVPPVVTPALMWCDNVIHGQDIRRPLGLVYPFDGTRLAETCECLTEMEWPSRENCRALDLRLVATDVDWSIGQGPEVVGPIESITLAIAGREVARSELSGPGVTILAER